MPKKSAKSSSPRTGRLKVDVTPGARVPVPAPKVKPLSDPSKVNLVALPVAPVSYPRAPGVGPTSGSVPTGLPIQPKPRSEFAGPWYSQAFHLWRIERISPDWRIADSIVCADPGEGNDLMRIAQEQGWAAAKAQAKVWMDERKQQELREREEYVRRLREQGIY